jgi:MmyB-like transcription regulator ligand binding domain
MRKEPGLAQRGQRVRIRTRETGMLVAARRLGPEPSQEAAAARRGEMAGLGDVAPGRAGRPAGVTRPGGQPDAGVPAFMHALLRQLEPFPAAVLNECWDILAFNRSYDALFSLESVPARSRNAVLLYFTDPGLRQLWPDWADSAPHVVRQFRVAMARHGGEPAWTVLLDRLRQASPDFCRLWEQDAEDGARGPGNVPERFVHPVAGPLRLARFRLWAEPGDEGLAAVGYTPADVATAAKLPRLQALSTAPVSGR